MGLRSDIFPPAAWLAAFASLAVMLLGGRLLAPPVYQRVALPAAIAIGFLSGYAALPRSWAAFAPQPGQAWQWLPSLGVVAAAASALILRPEYGRAIRWPIVLGIAALAGFLPTPTWPIGGLSWPISTVIAIVYLLSLSLALGAFAGHLRSGWLMGLLTITATVLAFCIAAAISIRLANLAAIAAGAWGGSWISCLGKAQSAAAVRPPWIIFAGSWVELPFSACVEPERPLLLLLLVPALPLAASPFARRTIG